MYLNSVRANALVFQTETTTNINISSNKNDEDQRKGAQLEDSRLISFNKMRDHDAILAMIVVS